MPTEALALLRLNASKVGVVPAVRDAAPGSGRQDHIVVGAVEAYGAKRYSVDDARSSVWNASAPPRACGADRDCAMRSGSSLRLGASIVLIEYAI
jgi:hypothetical protein